MVKIDWLVSRETHCSSRFRWTRTSSWCETFSVPSTCGATGSSVTVHVASEDVEDIGPNLGGDGTPPNIPSPGECERVVVGTSTGSGPVGRCPDR